MRTGFFTCLALAAACFACEHEGESIGVTAPGAYAGGGGSTVPQKQCAGAPPPAPQPAAGARAAATGKPNVVFVLTDDMSANLLQYMPNVQAMQREGTTFSNYFVTNSLCCPSRSSIFTGKYPHNTGVTSNHKGDGGYDAFQSHGNEGSTFAVALQGAGYRTALLGKYLNNYEPDRHPVPKGWDEWDVGGKAYKEYDYALNQNGCVHQYGSAPTDYLTDVLSGLADSWMQRTAPTAPFFLEVATFAPHQPHVPAPQDAEALPGLKAPHTAAYGARPDEAAPTWLKRLPALHPNDEQKFDRHFRQRAQSLLAVDRMVGRLRATLAAMGATDTYVVFSSDNGLHLGEYSMHIGKMTPFDIDTRVPLVIVGPGVPAGKVVDAMVANVDLCPTFTELAGSPGAPTAPDGRSILALLKAGGALPDWRSTVLLEHHRPFQDSSDPDVPVKQEENPSSYNALRTPDALYVEYEGGETSFYDLARDPEALHSVFAQLPPDRRARFHQVLRANVDCKGAEACWNAARLVP